MLANTEINVNVARLKNDSVIHDRKLENFYADI